MKQLGTATLLYLADWDETCPRWSQAGGTGILYWPTFYAPYTRGDGLFRCPSATRERERLADYSLLTWGPGGRGTAESPYWRWPGYPLGLARIPRPSETLALLDGETSLEMTKTLMDRHADGANGVFLDGHAAWSSISGWYAVRRGRDGVVELTYMAADR